MNASEVVVLLKVLVATYPNWKPSADTAEVWTALLVDQDAREITRAAVQYARSPVAFPPSPGELIALAKPAVGGRMLALEAWGEVVQAITHFGRYAQPTFTDLRIAECVRLIGGWERMCEDGISNPAHRARFVELWDGLAVREDRVRDETSANALLDGLFGGRLMAGGDGPRRLMP